MKAAGTAFASDFDGTLCQSNWDTGEEHFVPEVLDAVRRYQEAGGLFGICTGRPLSSVLASLEGILDLDFYIVTTGAQVLDRECRPIFERAFDRDVAQQLYERYATNDTKFVAVTDTSFVSVGSMLSQGIPVVSTLDEVSGTLLGVSLECHEDMPHARFMRDDINERFADVIEGFQNLGSVDVVPAGCSKGTGVALLRKAFSVACVAGAGDSFNDLPLLSACDVSYTFHPSPQEVRDAATHVVSDLAEALTHFMDVV